MARNLTTKIRTELGTDHIQRINWRHVAIVGGVLACLVILVFAFRYVNNRWVRASALSQAAKARTDGDVDLALRHLDRYLAANPDDVRALEAKSKILGDPEVYLPQSQLIDAARSLDQLIRLDPMGEGRLETRRKLAEFYIRFSDYIKEYAESSSDPDVERHQARYTTAAKIATQLVEFAAEGKYQDPVAHRLLARAYEGQISEIRGRRSLIKDDPTKTRDVEEDLRLKAIQQYKIAIQLDPHDLESSTRLAGVYLNWSKDLAAADAVLDAMLQANPKSVAARMVRYRAFSTGRENLGPAVVEDREARAQAELKEILALDPDNVEVRLNIAQVALGHRRPIEARRQLDAIPAAKQDDLRVKILRGYMEFAEQHPDDAIDQWRRGLLLVGGSDQELTWRLAFNLVQLGRFTEAEPLRKQYLRLSRGDKNGLGRFLDALFDIGEGRLYKAKRNLEKIKDVVSNTYKADVLLALGRCCDLMGEGDAALLAFRSAAAASPSAASPRLAIARHLLKRHPDEAIAEVDRALAESPEETFLLLESIRLRILAIQARPSSDPKRAREIEDLFARVEKVAPTNPTLTAYRAEYLSATGQLPRAVESLTKAVEGEARKLPEIWINLALALDRQNRRPEALQVLERAAAPENAGDRVKIRIARARLLARSGRGQAAREVLANNPEGVDVGERPVLAQALGELLRELGDRDRAIAAFAEWARLAPKVPGPALALLAMAQSENDERAARLGLEALKAIGGDLEPYGIAAQALDLIRADPNRKGPPPADRLYEAERLVKTLREEAPSLRFGSLLEGMILELKKETEPAINAYRKALKDDIVSPALPKLIEILIKNKRFEELARLRREYDEEVSSRQQPGLLAEFDRIATAVSLKLGEKDRADYLASRVVDNRRDDFSARRAYAFILNQNNEPEQAEESIKEMIKERPNDSRCWLDLIALQSLRKTPADVARTIGQARREYAGERPELFLAQCYWVGKDIPRAKEAFKKAVDVRPEDLVTLRSLAEFYDRTGQGDLIEPVLRKVLKLDPKASWAGRMLAMRLSDRPDPATWPQAWALVAPESPCSGDTLEDRSIRATVLARNPESRRREEAVEAFLSLANDLPITHPLAIDTRLRLAQAMIDANRFPQAWDAIKPIADDQARPSLPALALAIESLARANQPDEAQARLDRLKSLDPTSTQVPYLGAWIASARGKKGEAVALLESAYQAEMKAKGPSAEAIGLGAIDRMSALGDLDAALRVARSLADRWPADAWALAKVHVFRKEYDLAFAASEKGLEAGSPRESLRCAMSAALPRRDDAAFVQKVLDLGLKARIKDPNDYNIPIFLASIYHFQDRYQEEMACYRKALELYPTNVQFLNNMAWMLSEGLNQPEEGLKIIQEAIRREGEAPEHLDTRGVIEERLGQLDRAIADLERSVKGSPIPATYFHLARAYLKAKRPDESRRCRDLAYRAKFDPSTLDPTDRTDLESVMGTSRPATTSASNDPPGQSR